MHITLLQENLLEAVQIASRFISNKPQIPILCGIALRHQNGKLTLESTDMRMGVQTSLVGKGEVDGECVVPAKVFVDFLNSLSSGPVEIKKDGDNLVVTQKKAKAKIPTFSIAEFPPFPHGGENVFALDAKTFKETLDGALYAASIDETRPVLASLYLKIDEGGLTCVGTDGYRLSLCQSMVKEPLESICVLLPARAVSELAYVLGRSSAKEISLNVSKELSQVFCTIGNFVVLTRMVEGEYPPYSKIIPTSFAFETTIDREEWMGALKTAMIFARENSQVITHEFGDGFCRVLASGASLGENEGQIASSGRPEKNTKIAFNGKFILDVLSHIDSERVKFSMNDELKPGVITPEGKEFPLAVVMPFKR